GLERLDTWGPRGTATSRTFGYLEGVPFELIWWSREQAESLIDASLAGDPSGTPDALTNGVALRTCGLLAGWQARLRTYTEELAAARREAAAIPCGGFAAAGLLTIARPGERMPAVGWPRDAAPRAVHLLSA